MFFITFKTCANESRIILFGLILSDNLNKKAFPVQERLIGKIG